MDKHQKTISLLEAFLSDKVVDGVCGYMVIPDEDSIHDNTSKASVVEDIDSDGSESYEYEDEN